MSDSYLVSLGYSGGAYDNFYFNSKLKTHLTVISLIENANVPQLRGPVAPNEFTQQDEEACITRVLLVNIYNNQVYGNNTDVDLNTLITPQSLRDLLNEKMKVYH